MQKHVIALGADHAGYQLKKDLIKYAEELGCTTLDLGTDSEESYDYPLLGPLMADAMHKGATRGVLICGSGIGVDIAANRFKGIRSALCFNEELAKLARQHNNANVLSLGARFIDLKTAKACLKTFIETEFSPEERHHRRVEMMDSFV